MFIVIYANLMCCFIEQELPTELAQGYNIPCHGNVIFCNTLQNVEMDGIYSFHKGKPITLLDGWLDFCNEIDIDADTLIIVKVEMREECIRLEVHAVN